MVDASGPLAGEQPEQPEQPGSSEATEPPQTRRDAAATRRVVPTAQESSAAFQSHLRAARTDFEIQVAQARSDFEEVNERIKQRTGRNLILAILIGLAIGGVLIASLVFFKWAFVLFALGAALLGIFEFSRALNTAGRRVDLVPQLVGGAIIVVSGYFVDLWLHWVATFAVIALVIVWRLFAQMIAHDGRTYGEVLGDVLIGGFIQLYVPFLTSLTLIVLRNDGGEWWVLGFIIVTVAVDTGAYAAGITLGRTPMAPRISPKKTWEGFGGAAVASVAAGVLLGMYMIGVDWWMGAILGVLILGSATIGDLGESMIKRDLGIKDMSSWLPGHGGVLDRLDSILPSAGVTLALFYLFTPVVAT